MAKTKSKATTRPAYCAAYDGGVRIDNLALGADNPQLKIEDAFRKARYWYTFNLFVRTMLQLRLSFYMHGFEVKGPRSVQSWLKENNAGKGRPTVLPLAAQTYARDCWTDWSVTENVACIWRKKPQAGQPQRPVCYPVEDTEYVDRWGIEKLEIDHKLPAEEISRMATLIPQDERKLFATGSRLVLTHQHAIFDFDVLKRERVGNGYGWPGMAVLFQTCSQEEGMEVGDALLGNVLRNVIELHKLGHETRYGALSGSKANFMKKDQAKAVEEAVKGKKGHIRLVANWDHTIQYVLPDPKQFDAKRYDGVFRRLEAWAMPLAQMVFARGLNPYLMDALRQQAHAERDILRPHLHKVFCKVLGMPTEAELVWSDQCFRDSKLMADLVKFGLASGPLSQTSFTEFACFDRAEELERKKEEAGLPKTQVQPLYDPHHGEPGAKKAKNPGRKRGTADGQG